MHTSRKSGGRSRRAQDAGRDGALMSELLLAFRAQELELKARNEELHRLQNEIEQARSVYWSLFNVAPIGYLLFRPNGQVVDANSTVCRMLGYTRDHLFHKPFHLLVQRGYRTSFQRHLHDVFRDDESHRIELQLRLTNGSIRMYEFDSVKTGDAEPTCRTAVSDLSERREFEERLLYQSHLLSIANDAIVAFDRNWQVTYWNTTAEAMYGWKWQEVVGKSYESVFGGLTLSPERLRASRDLNRGGMLRGELIHSRKDGSQIWVESVGRAFLDKLGSPEGYVFVMRDITERKNDEESLRKREQEYRFLIEEASDGIILIDRDGYIVTANKRACGLLGYEPEELRFMYALSLLDKENLAVLEPQLELIGKGLHVTVEHRARRRDGSGLWIETSARKLDDGRIQAIIRDITQRKNNESAMVAAIKAQIFERLFALLHEFEHGETLAMNLHRLSLFTKNLESFSDGTPGESSGDPASSAAKSTPRDRLEIAVKEFRSIGYPRLISIASLLNTTSLEEKNGSPQLGTPEPGKTIESLATALDADAADLLHLFQTVRDGGNGHGFTDLGGRISIHVDDLYREIRRVIDRVNVLFATDISEIIRTVINSYTLAASDIVLMFDDGCRGVKAIMSPSDFGEVLQLLLNNSMEALSGIRNGSGNARKRITVISRENDRSCLIQVEDNGPGIPDEIAGHLFEKGFTTKGTGHGHGLDFAREHVSKYGGKLGYDASYLGGTRFVIELTKA